MRLGEKPAAQPKVLVPRSGDGGAVGQSSALIEVAIIAAVWLTCLYEY
jgi:hypothetical protein